MRDHPVAALIGLLMVCFHLAGMTMAILEARDGESDDQTEYEDDPYAW